MSVSYTVVVAKGDERTTGSAKADVTFTVPLAVVAADNFDAAVSYMQGKLKATGDTGVILTALRSGTAQAALTALAADAT